MIVTTLVPLQLKLFIAAFRSGSSAWPSQVLRVLASTVANMVKNLVLVDLFQAA